jgi:uncharacterized membrane protein
VDFLNISFFQGICASLLVAIFFPPVKNRLKERFDRNRLSKLERQLNMLKWEKEHLEKVKKSSIALNRAAFSDVFAVLLFMSLGLVSMLIAIPIKDTGVAGFLTLLVVVCSSIFWIAALYLAFENLNKFRNLNIYAKAIDNFDSKIDKVKAEIDLFGLNK